MKKLVTILVILGMAGVASGAVVNPATIAANANKVFGDGFYDPDYEAINAANGRGMSGGLHSATEYDGWLGQPMTGTPAHGGLVSATLGWIVFDLGEAYDISELKVWNVSGTGASGYGLRNVVVQHSLTGSTSETGDWTTAFTGEMTKGPNASDTEPYPYTQIIDMGDASMRYVGITVNSNWNGSTSYTGLNEVQFEIVPEPMTLAVLALASGLVLLRRRR